MAEANEIRKVSLHNRNTSLKSRAIIALLYVRENSYILYFQGVHKNLKPNFYHISLTVPGQNMNSSWHDYHHVLFHTTQYLQSN